MACSHVPPALKPPSPSQPVYREDCTLCFDSIDSPDGLDVCLTCFNGGCVGSRGHNLVHANATSHPMAVNIKRTRKRKQRSEPPQKMSKLAIAAETEEDIYDTTTQVRCYLCEPSGQAEPQLGENEGKVKEVVQGILRANTFARQEEVKAWEQEMVPCEHTLCLEQEPSRNIEGNALGHCSMCELNENLWLCLTCGNLGCGRAQFGGVGGNSHGLAHTDSSGHPVAVKLGSLTADGSADIYCYACNEERVDPELVAHLANWGIDLAGRTKTEKSLTEQQIEQNLKWEFSMTDQDGRELKPLFGEGLTGLKNLGNSCYLASVVQSLFSMKEFQDRYNRPGEQIKWTDRPAEDLEVQLRKMAEGLLSGRYSLPDSDVRASEDNPEKPHQKGLAPAMLKHLVGRGHSEFSTMRQQDAFEFLLHLLKLVSRSQSSAKSTYSDVTDPVDAFRFVMEQRLQCLSCKKVRYRQDEMENISVAVPIKRLPQESKDTAMTNGSDTTNSGTNPAPEKEKEEFEPVTLAQCLADFTATEVVELTCPSCSAKQFTKQSLFRTFPTILAVNARRFEIVNWVPTKQDVPVIVEDAALDLAPYRSKGLQPGEEVLPDDADVGGVASAGGFVPNPEALSMLEAMGFPKVRCEKALHATGNSDAEAATTWLFGHMEDPDIDEPIDLGGGSGAGSAASSADPEKIEALGNMGFGAPQARQALKETGGDVERAVDWLFSHPDAQGLSEEDIKAEGETQRKKEVEVDEGPAKFGLESIVCHKGGSIHAGHYVAFIKKEPGWVLFNDEKVALGGDVDEMKKFAYIYFFRREGK
ncbi:ubiquitin carboxyl-terminal hydrolase-2 [Elsinoe australis]|uniref:Ubiquitin carboxyl-terminal hydrolase n=1 Tax=Elsinoe australis TaxID=40998 RepID=A0A4U7BAC2_9PEZI|nr:ubiquitin carboxyl-terminal hydrolase-2 [Elsinoe australis]